MKEEETWEEEFEKKFCLVGTDERDFNGQGTRDEIKSFIRSLLLSQLTTLQERMPKEKEPDAIREAVDKSMFVTAAEMNGYNSCLADLTTIIETMKKEVDAKISGISVYKEKETTVEKHLEGNTPWS